jgi:superfamily II DNA or RNA helicase
MTNNINSEKKIEGFSASYGNKWKLNPNLLPDTGNTKNMILKPWQRVCCEGIIEEVVKGDKVGGLVNSPTGSGKTSIILYSSDAFLEESEENKVLISVPKRDIALGFIGKEYNIDGKFIQIDKTNEFCIATDKEKTKCLVKFLKDPFKHKSKRIAICTHQALIKLFKHKKINKLKKLKNILFVVDEAHHVNSENSNELGKIEKFISDNHETNNLKILLATATFFRGDRSGIVTDIDDYHRYTLHLDDHFEYCSYLKNIKYDFLVTEKDWETSISSQIKDGDRTILFIPHTSSKYLSSDKYVCVKQVMKNLSDSGVKPVLSKDELYYTITRNGKEFKIIDLVDDRNSELRKNRDIFISKNADKVDMILTMCKFKEGSDWPICNNVIIIGARNSLSDLIQMIGRSFRDDIIKQGKPVTVVHLIPDIVRTNLDPDLGEKVNEFFQCVFSCFVTNECFKPRKLDLEIEPAIKNIKKDENGQYNFDSLFSTKNEQIEFEESLTNELEEFKASHSDLSKEKLKEEFLRITKEKVRNELPVKNSKNIEAIAKDIIDKYQSRTKTWSDRIKLPSNELKIDYNMIKSELEKDDVLGYRIILSTGIWGITDSKKLREAIGLSLEASSNNMTHGICKWIKKNVDEYPKYKNDGSIESGYAKSISHRKQAKKGKGRCKFYPSDLKIAESYGYGDLFDTEDDLKNSLERLERIAKYKKAEGKFPSYKYKDKDEQVKSDSIWITRMRKKKEDGTLPKELLKRAKELGIEDVFDRTR